MLRQIIAKRLLPTQHRQIWSLQQSPRTLSGGLYLKQTSFKVSPVTVQQRFLVASRPSKLPASASAQEDQKGSESSVRELGTDMVSLQCDLSLMFFMMNATSDTFLLNRCYIDVIEIGHVRFYKCSQASHAVWFCWSLALSCRQCHERYLCRHSSASGIHRASASWLWSMHIVMARCSPLGSGNGKIQWYV